MEVSLDVARSSHAHRLVHKRLASVGLDSGPDICKWKSPSCQACMRCAICLDAEILATQLEALVISSCITPTDPVLANVRLGEI